MITIIETSETRIMPFDSLSTFDVAALAPGAEVHVYTDGAAIDNPGPAGSAFVVVIDGAEVASFGKSLGTASNNIAEMTGALDALRFFALRSDLRLTLFTDSQYVQKGMTEWMPGWLRRNWRGSSGPVKNVPMWEALNAAAEPFAHLKWVWVRGHAGNVFNERADAIAERAAAESACTPTAVLTHLEASR